MYIYICVYTPTHAQTHKTSTYRNSATNRTKLHTLLKSKTILEILRSAFFVSALQTIWFEAL